MNRRVISNDGQVWRFDDTSARLGDGAHGVVYPGLNAADNEVAIKWIADGAVDRQLRREEQIGKLLQARAEQVEHLIVPLAVVEQDQDLFIVMPRADNSLARALTDDGPFDLDKAREVISQVAGGLEELQDLLIAHRDVKPANVLRHDGRWKLTDFGISRNLAAQTSTATWIQPGTALYRAPELWSNEPKTLQSDLYSLGVLAYEVLTGNRPFVAVDYDMLRAQHLSEPPPRLPDTVPLPLARLVYRLLAKAPAERPQNPRAVVESLARAAGSGSPALTALHRAAARDTIRAAERAADSARAAAAAERIERLKLQARGDLIEIFETAEAEANKGGLDDAVLSKSEVELHLRLGSARITAVVWPRTPEPAFDSAGTEFVLAGVVYAGRHTDIDEGQTFSSAPPVANIVYKISDGDRQGRWRSLKFSVQGRAGTAGVPEPEFHARFGQMHQMGMRRFIPYWDEFTPDTVIETLTAALDGSE